ncbi:MAG: AlpA family transcriptional regulator [Formivibrio sp.]|nr:AlpA family transcriptional regulator [Formivibrio sp.]
MHHRNKTLPAIAETVVTDRTPSARIPFQQPDTRHILLLPQVMAMTGLARSTIYLHMDQGIFPKPIKLGPNSVGWLESDIDAWFDERIANRNAVEVGHA